MKALQIPEPGRLAVVQIPPAAAPGPGEVLVKILYAGFCGTDLNTWRGRNAMAKDKVIPGHEIGARILKAGEGVPFKEGQIVTVDPYTACGHCDSCHNGRRNACEHNETLGVQRDGAMREEMVLPCEKIIPVDGISPRDCALIEPMSVGFHAVSRAQVKESDTVMVFGCGMVGMGAVIGAAARGAKVIAVDLDDDKLAIARRAGAAVTVNSSRGNLHEMIGEKAPDVVIEAVGNPGTQKAALEEVAYTGRIVLIGYAKGDSSLPTQLIVKKELDLRGTRNALREDFEAVIDYMKKGTCPVDDFVSGVVSPEDAQKAMEEWSADPGKVFRILVEF